MLDRDELGAICAEVEREAAALRKAVASAADLTPLTAAQVAIEANKAARKLSKLRAGCNGKKPGK